MGNIIYSKTKQTKWFQDTVKEARVSERASERSPLRDTPERPTSHSWKESPSQPSEDLPEEVVLREFPSSSTTTLEISLRDSSPESSRILSPTPSMLRERPSPPWTLSMLSRDKEEPSMVSVPKQINSSILS